MAGFVQIIQFKTSKFDEMQKVIDKFREETARQAHDVAGHDRAGTATTPGST